MATYGGTPGEVDTRDCACVRASARVCSVRAVRVVRVRVWQPCVRVCGVRACAAVRVCVRACAGAVCGVCA